MPIMLIDFAFASFVVTIGVALGWWLHSRRAGRRQASEETRHARDVLGRLHDLAARVAADVGEHSSRVEEINEELTSTESSDTDVVVTAVQKLVEANDQMQAQLCSAEDKLQEQARQIKSHATEARTDALTGLANRRAFDDETTRLFAEFQRRGQTFSIVMIDVDHFKKFNDTHGHQAGDEVLRGVGRVLQKSTRGTAVAARYGGEEFAVILPGTSVTDATVAAERVRRAIADTDFHFQGNTLRVTVSVGVADLIRGEDIAAMIERSDVALYTSKAAGRDRTHWHDGQQAHPVNQETEQPQVEPEVPKPEEAESEPVQSPPEDSLQQPEPATEQPTAEKPTDSTEDPDDQLHGFCDGATFCRVVDHRLAEWRRGGEPPSILFIRVDDYQRIVSARGKQVGDQILKTTTQFLNAAIRDMDLAAHYEASTFALLLPGAGLVNAVGAGERLRKAIARCSIPADDGELQFTVSIGGAEATADDDIRRLLERGQQALGAAVKSGGDCSYFHNGQWSETLKSTMQQANAS